MRSPPGHVALYATYLLASLVEWINTSVTGFPSRARGAANPCRPQHGSCPTCRDVFLEFPREEDVESSDGGEYIPDDDMATDYDGFDTTDGEAYTDEDMSDWGDAIEEDDYSFSSDPASATNDDDDDDDLTHMSGVVEPEC